MKQKVFCSIFFFTLLNGHDKVDSKVQEIGSHGRKEIKIKMIEDKLKLISANDEVSEYELLINKSIKLSLFQYGGDVADVIKVGDFKYAIANSPNPLIEKDFNPRFLATDMIKTYMLYYKRDSFLIIIAKSAGAAGKAINYSLYQIFDVTNVKKIKYYPATSYYGDIKNIADLDLDGKLDFLKVKEKKSNLYEMKAFEIFTGRQKNIKGQQSITF